MIVSSEPVLVVPDLKNREVSYFTFTDGDIVGYKIVRDDGAIEYLYFNPSNNQEGEDDPNVFVYQGSEGDPNFDQPCIHFTHFED